MQLDINVVDVNDHAPVFSQPLYHTQVSEDADTGIEIVQLNATDADRDKRVFYALHAASSATSLRKFKVDSTRGVITLAERLDRYNCYFISVSFSYVLFLETELTTYYWNVGYHL